MSSVYHEIVNLSGRAISVAVHFCKGHKGQAMFLPHWHESVEILYLRQGGMQVLCDKDLFEVKEGDIVFVNPSTVHSGRCTAETVAYSCFIIDLKLFIGKGMDVADRELYALQKGVNKVSPVIRGDGGLNALLEEIIRLNEQPMERYAMLIKAKLFLLLSILIHDYKNRDAVAAERPGTEGIVRVLDYLNADYQNQITLEDMALRSGFAQTYFCKAFKRATGQTPVEYLNTVRIHKAYELLADTSLPVSEVSARVGFQSQNYFCRQFKKHLGVSPTQVRKASLFAVHADGKGEETCP